VQDNTVSDEVLAVFPKDPGRYRMEYDFLTIQPQGMTRIGSSLETGNPGIVRGQDIHRFAFAFIAPLQAQQHICFHTRS
jgi:hypothetical protein